MNASLSEIPFERIPLPPLYLEIEDEAGELHQCVVTPKDPAPDWLPEAAPARVASPNGVIRNGRTGRIHATGNSLYAACQAILGGDADWLPKPPPRDVFRHHAYRLWFDDKPAEEEHAESIGKKMLRFKIPRKVRHAALEVWNAGGPRLFAPLEPNSLLYFDILEGDSGAYLCPRVMSNFDLPAAFWGFRRNRFWHAAQVTAEQIARTAKNHREDFDWNIASAHALLLHPSLADNYAEEVMSGLRSIADKSSDAEICLLMLTLNGAFPPEEAASAARHAISRIASDPPRFACTLEILDGNFDALVEWLGVRNTKDRLTDAVDLITRRLAASYGRGDLNVFVGRTPQEPDQAATGEATQKKSST